MLPSILEDHYEAIARAEKKINLLQDYLEDIEAEPHYFIMAERKGVTNAVLCRLACWVPSTKLALACYFNGVVMIFNRTEAYESRAELVGIGINKPIIVDRLDFFKRLQDDARSEIDQTRMAISALTDSNRATDGPAG